MSHMCLEAWQTENTNETTHCFPNHYKYGLFTDIWCVVNGIIGFTGNLLTLLAIPFCSINKK